MTSDEIFAAIEEIAATPGKNDKIALVTKYSADAEFVRVLKATYNPHITYGVRKFTVTGGAGTEQFGDSTWQLLDNLASRVLTGRAALYTITAVMGRLTPTSATLLQRIILKDMRAGFDAETCNKAQKGMVPVYPYMRCSLPKDAKMDTFFEDGALIQEKADGMFVNVNVTDAGEVQMTTRQGTLLPINEGGFEDFAQSAAHALAFGTQTHGELLVVRDDKVCERQDGNGVLNHVISGGSFLPNERVLFLAWDQIPLAAVKPKGKYEVAYSARLNMLISQLQTTPSVCIQVIETEEVHSMAQALVFNAKKLLQKKEGSVLKKANAIWKDGTSREQVKLKIKAPFEARVKDFKKGNGKNADKLSAMLCQSECGALEFYVACRGDAMIDDVTANPENWRNAVVTCEGNAVLAPSDSNPKHSIFLPIFVERRIDKSEADSLARIKAQFEAAVTA